MFTINNASINHFHNILRVFDVSSNFLFITSEVMRDYYLETRYRRVASKVTERLRLRILGNWEILGKYLNFME